MKLNRTQRLLAGLTACLIGAVSLSEPISVRADAAKANLTLSGIRLETLAGVPGNAYRDGTGQDARFASALGLDVKNGTILIADTENNMIRRYTSDMVSTIAGNRDELDAYGNAKGGFRSSICPYALFDSPADCLLLDDGTIYVADRDNHAIRMIMGKWVVTHGEICPSQDHEKVAHKDKFSSPSGLAIDANGTIYVADTGNHCIRTIVDDNRTEVYAGQAAESGWKDGPLSEARFQEPTAVAVGDDGTIYIADSGNQRIRKIQDGIVTTLSGGSVTTYLDTEYLAPEYVDGSSEEARFRFPEGICVAGSVVLVADTGNHVIRAVAPSGYTETIAGTGDAGYLDGAPLEAELNRPSDLAWEDGILYIMDSGNSALRAMPFDPQAWLNARNGL